MQHVIVLIMMKAVFVERYCVLWCLSGYLATRGDVGTRNIAEPHLKNEHFVVLRNILCDSFH